MDENNISVEEVMKITHNRRNVHIPRKAFEDYMNNFSKSPSEQLIIALLNSLNEKKHSSKQTSAQHST